MILYAKCDRRSNNIVQLNMKYCITDLIKSFIKCDDTYHIKHTSTTKNFFKKKKDDDQDSNRRCLFLCLPGDRDPGLLSLLPHNNIFNLTH